jgi:hypothetical protein
VTNRLRLVAQLARILTMRGVEHMLWEERSRG